MHLEVKSTAQVGYKVKVLLIILLYGYDTQGAIECVVNLSIDTIADIRLH